MKREASCKRTPPVSDGFVDNSEHLPVVGIRPVATCVIDAVAEIAHALAGPIGLLVVAVIVRAMAWSRAVVLLHIGAPPRRAIVAIVCAVGPVPSGTVRTID